MVGTVAGDDTIFVALNGKKGGYESVAQRLARLGAYVDPED
jgi:arginine repressor